MANSLSAARLDEARGEGGQIPRLTRHRLTVYAAEQATPTEAFPNSLLRISPETAAKRLTASWRGVAGEIVQFVNRDKFELRAEAPNHHLLIVYERATRQAGETIVAGRARSSLRHFSQKMSFVPAGCRFQEWHEPLELLRAVFLFVDPLGPLFAPELGFDRVSFAPRLFFESRILQETARKLATLIETGGHHLYAEALSVVLAHELMRLNETSSPGDEIARGGLASWQQKLVAQYIEENLGARIALGKIAALAKLSPYHFSRAFKKAFGVPPHRYHAQRRIERAKILLAQPKRSITDVALELGFSEAGAFSRTFHKLTGRTPRAYRRSLV